MGIPKSCFENTLNIELFIIIHHEQVLDESETISETSLIENINVTENSSLELHNFGLLNFNNWCLFNPSTGILHLDFQKCVRENNFDQEAYPTFYQENLINIV
ncbi:20182_t:CDS:2, partial [Gigaspora margarita]